MLTTLETNNTNYIYLVVIHSYWNRTNNKGVAYVLITLIVITGTCNNSIIKYEGKLYTITLELRDKT